MPPTKKKKTKIKKQDTPELPCDNYLYEKQEIILCYHGALIYKAKVLKRTVQQNEPLYFVHYHGWNKQWDEWVDHLRCLKKNAENEATMKDVKAQVLANEQANKGGGGGGGKSASPDTTTTTTTTTKASSTSTKRKSNSSKRKRQIHDSSESDATDVHGTRERAVSHVGDDKKERESESVSEQERKLNKLRQKHYELKKVDLDDKHLLSKIKSMPGAHKQAMDVQQNEEEASYGELRHGSAAATTTTTTTTTHTHSPQPTENASVERQQFEAKVKSMTIPTALKDHLVEQYYLIHYDEKLIKLPKPNGFRINDILNEVLQEQQRKLQQKQEKKSEDLNIVSWLPQVNDALRGFFKNTLVVNLLYNFEKPQYEALMQAQQSLSSVDVCDVYGVEHLIRLLWMLPNVLVHTQGLTEESFSPIKQCVSIIIQFLCKHKSKYLVKYHDIEQQQQQQQSNENQDKAAAANISQFTQDVDEAYIAKTKKIAQKYESKFRNICN